MANAVRVPSSGATKYTSLNLRESHMDRIAEMVNHTGLNRNQLFRLLIENLTDTDLDRIMSKAFKN